MREPPFKRERLGAPTGTGRLQQRDDSLDRVVGVADGADRVHAISRTSATKAAVAAERSSARQATLRGTLTAGRPESLR